MDALPRRDPYYSWDTLILNRTLGADVGSCDPLFPFWSVSTLLFNDLPVTRP